MAGGFWDGRAVKCDRGFSSICGGALTLALSQRERGKQNMSSSKRRREKV